MDKNSKLHPAILYSVIALFFFVVFLIGKIPGLSFKIYNATPFLLLPALLAATMFFKEWFGFLAGLIIGFMADTVTPGTMCLNTFLLMLLGLAAGLMSSYLLNINIRSALALSFLCSAVYFAVRWFFLVFLGSEPDKLSYLLQISLPSAVYTALFIIPFYFLFKWYYKRYAA